MEPDDEGMPMYPKGPQGWNAESSNLKIPGAAQGQSTSPRMSELDSQEDSSDAMMSSEVGTEMSYDMVPGSPSLLVSL